MMCRLGSTPEKYRILNGTKSVIDADVETIQAKITMSFQKCDADLLLVGPAPPRSKVAAGEKNALMYVKLIHGYWAVRFRDLT